jgi:nitrate/nitrite-specific signal transduction histidine kinase
MNIMTYRAKLSGGELVTEEPGEGGTVISCVIHPTAEEANERVA